MQDQNETNLLLRALIDATGYDIEETREPAIGSRYMGYEPTETVMTSCKLVKRAGTDGVTTDPLEEYLKSLDKWPGEGECPPVPAELAGFGWGFSYGINSMVLSDGGRFITINEWRSANKEGE